MASCSFVGALLGNFPMDRVTNPGLTFCPWVSEVVISWILQFSRLAVYAAAAFLMPAYLDWSTWAIVGGFLLVHFALEFGLQLRLLCGLGLLKPASVRLQSLVDETAAQMGVRVKATWEMERTAANALALIKTRELVFTKRLLRVCPDEELKAICAHELGHLTESRLALVGRLVGSLKFFPMIFIRPVYAEWQSSGLIVLSFAPILISLGQGRLSRALEKRADRIAHESVEDPATYARALERLYITNKMPAVLSKGGVGPNARTHPDLYDRMLAAGLTPDYPRPLVPASRRWTSQIVVIIGTVLAIWVIISQDRFGS